MKKWIYLAILTFLLEPLHAQLQPVDMAALKGTLMTADGKSKYKSTTDRYISFDSTLSGDDYRFLYFGFVYQEDYSPFPEDKKREIVAALKENNFRGAANMCDTVLEKYPFNLSANYDKGDAFFKFICGYGQLYTI